MKRMKHLFISTALAAVLAACGAGPAKDTVAEAASTEPSARVLDTYEKTRALLANDTVDGVAAAAKDLREAAEALAGKLSGDPRDHASELAAAAGKLESAAADGIGGARTAFGHVSEHFVALLASDPELAQGRFVFECPMAQGYQKWVQADDKISNPYFGSAMLTCGMASKWED